MRMPIGYRFDPTDEDIVLHYLYNKTHDLPLSSTSAVIECDIYDETDTWKRFFEATRETSLYFFTKLRKKSEKGSRAERATGSGTWRAQNEKDLYKGGDRTQPIGYKRSFTFVPSKKNAEEKGKWVMHEYRLHEKLLMKEKGDLVVCRIKKNVTRGERSTRKLTSKNNNENSMSHGHKVPDGGNDSDRLLEELDEAFFILENSFAMEEPEILWT